jgi:hypothetical protein
MQSCSGLIIAATGTYVIPFIIVSLTYLLTILFMHLLAPTLAPIGTNDPRGFDVMV